MSIKYFLIACLVLAVIPQSVICQDVASGQIAYNKWRINNKRIYLNDHEQLYRQTVFFENYKLIQEHANNKESTYQLGLNQYSDMTNEEFVQKVLNSGMATKSSSKRIDDEQIEEEDEDLFQAPRGAGATAPPASVDWRSKGIVTPIKNQGQCGSCWTFATAGVLESLYAQKNGKQVLFSEQQLLDCVSPQYGFQSNGCGGGYPEYAFQYVSRIGILQASQYPYVGYQGQCKVAQYLYYNQVIGFKQSRHQRIEQTPAGMKAAIAYSPVQAAVNASAWQNYRGGIFTGCGSYTYQQQLNHAVVIIGYDAQGNWLVKNSFGTSWGEQGYMRLSANQNCGVLLDAILAI